jgi:hypothetical protein
MQLFLDCDGVLADFDHRVEELLGAPPKRAIDKLGLPEFWARLAKVPDFYATLPLMPDARELFDAVAHLNPVILTGCPRGGWAEKQKERWAAKHFPGTTIITCMAANKRQHCSKGDVLVDDTDRFRPLWEKAGGTFVHHKNAKSTIAKLQQLFPDQGIKAA